MVITTTTTAPLAKSWTNHPHPLSGIPLGGIGTGTLEIRADGALHEWQIFNNAPWSGGLPPGAPPPPSPIRPEQSLFAVKTKKVGSDEPPVIRVLRRRTESEVSLAYTIPYVSNVETIHYTGEFPFAQLTYEDPALPVTVTLNTWSSFIPGDIKHSSLPATLFTFTISNPTGDSQEISLLSLMPSIFGSAIGAGTPTAAALLQDGRTSLVFSADGVPDEHPMARGSLALTALGKGVEVTPSVPFDGLLGSDQIVFWDGWARSKSLVDEGDTGGMVAMLGSFIAGLAGGQVDPELVYAHTPSLIRGSIEAALVPNPAEFQQRVAYDPIRYQNLSWRWVLILMLNLPAVLRAEIETETRTDPSLMQDVGRMKTRLMDLGAAQHINFEGVFGGFASGTREALRGAMTQTLVLAPGESVDLSYVLSWFFPNHRGQSPGEYLGHRYEEWFKDAKEVAHYVADHLDELRQRTQAFHNAQYQCRPYWLADAINAQLTTFTKSSWLTRDGRFGIWEGLGCCGLQTLDVSYYGSHTITLFFPELEARQLRMSAEYQLTPQSPRYDEYFLAFPRNAALVQERVKVDPTIATDRTRRLAMYQEVAAQTGFDPTGRMPHFFPGSFATVDAYHMNDLMPKFALQVLRDYQWTGDRAFLEQMWPHVKAAHNHNMGMDELNVGLPYHYDQSAADTVISAQTYDIWDFAGYSSYVSSIWLAALKAAEHMARLLGDDDYAETMEAAFQKGRESMERLLWNGEYYDLWVDPPTHRRNESCMADQLSGQWYATLLGLGDILPREHIISALKAINRYNRADGRGLLNGAIPPGKQADTPTNPGLGDPRLQSDTVWTGTEYATAILMLNEGMLEEGLGIIHDVYDRYEHIAQTWNHEECGSHYYRALCVWLAWMSLMGMHYDAANHSLSIAPQEVPAQFQERPIAQEVLRTPLVLPNAWGTIEHSSTGITRLSIQEGLLELSKLEMPLSAQSNVAVMLADKQMQVTREDMGLRFAEMIRIEAGQVLEVHIAV